MGFLRRYWVEIQRAWGQIPQGTPRGQRLAPRVEALEVRTLLAGEFTEASGIFTPARDSRVAWGDMDNDGDLDLAINGTVDGDPVSPHKTLIYKNQGNDSFQLLSTGIAGTYSGSVDWGDSDNDGDLDLLVTGRGNANTAHAKVYRNNGDETFTDTMAGLTPVVNGAAVWGDSDNDGDLDILLTGDTGNSVPTTKLYRNDGNNVFVEVNEGMSNVRLSAVAWGDSDNDGDLDVLVTGLDDITSTKVSTLYRNDGNNSFAAVNIGLTAVDRGAVAWGDYDNDGKLDILLTGLTGGAGDALSKIYRNLGNNTFSDIMAPLTPLSQGGAAWGDFDNDGDLDILNSGLNVASVQKTYVYRNDGGTFFTELTNTGLLEMHTGSLAWADTDNDGDLDFVSTGISPGSFTRANLYRNNSATANTAPNTPTNLTATGVSSTSLTFSWTAPTDSQTPSSGLSYNLRVGTTPGSSNVFSTMSDTDANSGNGPNGRRRVADSGPIQGTSYTLKNLTPGTTYYWSVQAVDTAFAGGAYAVEQSKLLTPVNTPPTLGGLQANQSVNDTTPISPFSTLTVTDPDTQSMFARVTILNGAVRGDFTTASAAGWTRAVSGNNILYTRFFNPQANIGSVVQAAIRPFVFQPRANAIKPNTTELTDITVFVNDGAANTTATTRLSTLSVNDAPIIGGMNNNRAVNDNSTVAPFPTLTVTDADMQDMLISVTILNGVVRGDFTNANAGTGWTVRQVVGNNITYRRYLNPQANIGAAAQAAFRALVFAPRQNAITPGTQELTDFQVTVSDGVASAVLGTGTRVTTTSVNQRPLIGGAVANQAMNDNQTRAVFSALTVTEPDAEGLFARITITGGATRGDFTPASSAGWIRKISGGDIVYDRYFSAMTNNGSVVQAAIRALIFQPRNNVPLGTTETTSFTVNVKEGSAFQATDANTSVITTGVAPRLPAPSAERPMFLDGEVMTIVVPADSKSRTSLLARLGKSRK